MGKKRERRGEEKRTIEGGREEKENAKYINRQNAESK